jgi:hypothetical protein
MIRFEFLHMSGHEYCIHHIAYVCLILLFLQLMTILVGQNPVVKVYI